jgi:hypothetical protein
MPGTGDFESNPGDLSNLSCYFYYLNNLTSYDDDGNPCNPEKLVCDCCQRCKIDSSVITLTSN